MQYVVNVSLKNCRLKRLKLIKAIIEWILTDLSRVTCQGRPGHVNENKVFPACENSTACWSYMYYSTVTLDYTGLQRITISL